MFYIRSLSEFCKSNAIDDAKRDEGLTTPDCIERFDNIRYGEHERNILDVYRPKDQKGKLPLIVSIHGGGWVYGSKEINQFYCMSLAERGFAVVNFSYRLAPEFIRNIIPKGYDAKQQEDYIVKAINQYHRYLQRQKGAR